MEQPRGFFIDQIIAAKMQRRNVIVVGAGPVGTVAALACARMAMRTLREAQQRIDDSPRASTPARRSRCSPSSA